MKKFMVCFVFTAALFFTGTELFAQGGNGGQKGQMKEMMKKNLKDSVGLSDVQIDSVMAIREEMQPKVKDVMKDQSLSDDDKKSKMEAIKKEMYERYKKAGLTTDQVKKIKEMDEKMREQMRNRKNK
ncbi:hypothetical protein FRZ67_06740 [Panacibacter ginsenosidivorans]|uniref:Periplasmic heavy metal sensor n=1 Tax=Panacibacter ginsenosidivorans TaxID=1813871 RepID=A0A5B8V6G9_9BACT|nr:hypothetical protein [Panacibacter ginsenosidivorans]QEC67004.1 hypothetical protein FRZ67_06740 [Panacibacter ginsenosidivorans]